METEQATQEAQAPASEKISVTTWFSNALKENKKLKHWHFDGIYAFFANRNVSDTETKETFERALKEYGF